MTDKPINVISGSPGYKGKSADEQEKYEFYAKLRKGDFAKRDLTSATAGAAMIAPPVLDEIFSMRFEYSLIDALGIKRHPTDALVTNVASEVTGHAIQAAIAEAAVHVENDPAFLLTAVTVLKYGSLITATEEFLEDQALFQSWFPRALGRQMALQENAIFYARTSAAGTLGVHLAASHTLTEAQMTTFYNSMPTQWRNGTTGKDTAFIIMNDVTMGVLRALLIATPRAYLSPPEYTSSPSGPEPARWMGLPMYLNSNWPAITGSGDAITIITLVHPDAVVFVERHGVQIHTDPYGDAANGRVRFTCEQRFNIACPIPLGIVRLEDHA